MDRSARHAVLQLRARLYAMLREFMAARGVTEVQTPILSAAGNTEVNLDGFRTRYHGPVRGGASERFLRTSPEYPLKRLLAEGFGDCYELGRVFRDGEAGRRHNPEFDMLEWYRLGLDHRELSRETTELVGAALALTGRTAEVLEISYRDLFLETLGLDPLTAEPERLAAPLARFAIDPAGLGRDDWLDLLLTHLVEPAFPADRITAIHDYPASQAMLARIRADDPPVAERFEIFLGPHELANGYHELNDPDEQRARFERDNAVRRARGKPELPLDENLLAVLGRLPDCAGVALGIERLLMAVLGSTDIAEVMAFPFAQA